MTLRQLLNHTSGIPSYTDSPSFRVEMFPTSSNPYDSLGEALAAAGKKNDAIKAYSRSLELDPSNLNAIDQLAKLAKK